MSIKSNNKSKIKFFIGNEYLKKCIRIITNNNTIFRLGDCFNYDEYLTMEIILKNDKIRWNWHHISNHKNIQISDILNNPNKRWNWGRISKNPNITMEFINNNLDKPISFYFLSENKNLTMKMILDNLDKKWDWNKISENPNITLKDITENKNLPWEWFGVSQNINITIDFILQNINKDFNWDELTLNKGLKIEDIVDNSTLPWNWKKIFIRGDITMDIISKNPHIPFMIIPLGINNITSDFIIKHLKLFNYDPNCDTGIYYSNYNAGSYYGCITIEDILNNLDKKLNWNWKFVSYNYTLKIKHVLDYRHLPWNWDVLSSHKNITMEDILNNPTLPWSLSEDYYPHRSKTIIDNPNFDIELLVDYLNTKKMPKNSFIKRNSLKNLNWKKISCHKNTTMNFILLNLDKPEQFKWCWAIICCNPNLTIDFVKNNLDKNLDWYSISCNKNITMDIIENNLNLPWVFRSIFNNPNLTISFITKYFNMFGNDYDLNLLCHKIRYDYYNLYHKNSIKKILLTKILFVKKTKFKYKT